MNNKLFYENIVTTVKPDYKISGNSLIDPFSGSEDLPLSSYDYSRHYGSKKFSQTPALISYHENKRRRFTIYPQIIPGTNDCIFALIPADYTKLYKRKTVLQIEELEFARVRKELTSIKTKYNNKVLNEWSESFFAHLLDAEKLLDYNASLLTHLESSESNLSSNHNSQSFSSLKSYKKRSDFKSIEHSVRPYNMNQSKKLDKPASDKLSFLNQNLKYNLSSKDNSLFAIESSKENNNFKKPDSSKEINFNIIEAISKNKKLYNKNSCHNSRNNNLFNKDLSIPAINSSLQKPLKVASSMNNQHSYY